MNEVRIYIECNRAGRRKHLTVLVGGMYAPVGEVREGVRQEALMR